MAANADARPVPTFHPVLRAILEDIVGELSLPHYTYNASVMTPVADVPVYWNLGCEGLLEVSFVGVLEHGSRLTVYVTVDPYFLDADIIRLKAEITKTAAAMPMVLPALSCVAREIIEHVQSDIQVGVQAFLYVQDIELEMHEYDEHFDVIETKEQWNDMLVNKIQKLVDADAELADAMAQDMSEEDTSDEDAMSD